MNDKVRMIREKCSEKEFREKVVAVLAVVLLYAGMQIAGITCPIKYFTGISCAGCGMTRAYLSLLHLQFQKAFYYHPLFWVPPLFLLCYLKREKMSKNSYRVLIGLFCVLFLSVYLYRMFWGEGTIVVCRPKDGCIFRFINIFI